MKLRDLPGLSPFPSATAARDSFSRLDIISDCSRDLREVCQSRGTMKTRPMFIISGLPESEVDLVEFSKVKCCLKFSSFITVYNNKLPTLEAISDLSFQQPLGNCSLSTSSQFSPDIFPDHVVLFAVSLMTAHGEPLSRISLPSR